MAFSSVILILQDLEGWSLIYVRCRMMLEYHHKKYLILIRLKKNVDYQHFNL